MIALMAQLLFFLFFAYVCYCDMNSSIKRCLPPKERSSIPRKFFFHGQEFPIIIETSPRPSHFIVSFILKILLEERFNYSNVEFNQVDWDGLDEILNRMTIKKYGAIPRSHINLEVWEKAGHTIKSRQDKYFINSGPLGPSVKKGIFASKSQTKYESRNSWLNLNKENNKTLSIYDKMGYENEFVTNLKIQYNVNIKSSGNFNAPQTNSNEELILNWFPNTLTLRDYNRINFPDCLVDGVSDSTVSNNKFMCEFQVHQLSKLIWAEFKTYAKHAYWLVTNFTLSQTEYIELLEKVKEAPNISESMDQYYNIACDWILNNSKVWKKWTPSWNKRNYVYLPILLSDYGPIKISLNHNASLVAVERLNERIIHNHDVAIIPIIKALQCNETQILNTYLSIMKEHESQILGTVVCLCPQSFDTVVKHSNIKRKLIISSSLNSLNKQNFTYFFSTQPSVEDCNYIVLQLMKMFNWRRMILLKKDNYMLNTFLLKTNDVEVLDEYVKSENEITFNGTKEFLKKAKNVHRATIYVVDYGEREAEMIMCIADLLDMTYDNGFLFILSPSFKNEKYEFDSSRPCSKIRNYLHIKNDHGSNHESDYFRVYNSPLTYSTTSAIRYLGETFENILNKIPNAHLFLETPDIIKRMAKLSDRKVKIIGNEGITSRRLFDANHHILAHWAISQARYVTTNDETFSVPIFEWHTQSGFDEYNLPRLNPVPFIDIHWGKRNKRVIDTLIVTRDCPVFTISEALGFDCTGTILFLHLIPIFCFAIIMTIIIMYCCKRKPNLTEEANLKEFDDLCEELSSIDINSTDVIINTQVGKGAFGIVYGGEAKKNNRWESVAIKLIDKEADCQGKIDFLMEAKLMRGLEHKNIVRLIGICLNPGKPLIYLVMELVLNGDLQDYLLTNRINAKNDSTNKSVSPMKLTGFVKDIACGAQYLHSKNLIHRDLACRNCFLSEDDVVKIGDFGLTREINRETEYYRVGRHFVLPARWMPPESIDLGYFSIFSDIWSFGVVVFEIVSFCTRPYYNISDDEVPEHVKANTRPLITYLPPEAYNTLVYKLINKCCQYQRQDRFESMDEILKFLDNNPNCIQAYLTDDYPHSANTGIINKMNATGESTSTSKAILSDVLQWKKWGSKLNISTITNQSAITDITQPVCLNHLNYASSTNIEDVNDQIYRKLNENITSEQFAVFKASNCENVRNSISGVSINMRGKKKKDRNNKRLKRNRSNLNNAKSKSSDVIARPLDDDQEQSFVSCPDNQQNSTLNIDPQDFQLMITDDPSSQFANIDYSFTMSGHPKKSNKHSLYFGHSRVLYKDGKNKGTAVHLRNPVLPKQSQFNNINTSSVNVPLLSSTSTANSNLPQSRSHRNSREYNRITAALTLFRDEDKLRRYSNRPPTSINFFNSTTVTSQLSQPEPLSSSSTKPFSVDISSPSSSISPNTEIC